MASSRSGTYASRSSSACTAVADDGSAAAGATGPGAAARSAACRISAYGVSSDSGVRSGIVRTGTSAAAADGAMGRIAATPCGGVCETLIASSASTSSAVYGTEGSGGAERTRSIARSIGSIGATGSPAPTGSTGSTDSTGSTGSITGAATLGCAGAGSRIKSAKVGRRGMVATAGMVTPRSSAERSHGNSRLTGSLAAGSRGNAGASRRRRKSSSEKRWLPEFGASESSLGTPCYRPRLTVP